MSWILALPVLLPLFTAAVLIFFRKSTFIQKKCSLLGAAASLIASLVIVITVDKQGTLVSQIGEWPAPFGISLVADRLSAILGLMTGILVLTCLIYSQITNRPKGVQQDFYPFILIMLAAANGAFLTADLFNLYVWFEVLLINSFSLLVLGDRKAQLKGAIPYIGLNLTASALFLTAIGLLYGLTGSLNMADLYRRLQDLSLLESFKPISILFLTAFGIKAAVFPLFFWLPRAYPTVPVTVSAVFSGILTKVAVYTLIRFTTLFLGPAMPSLQGPLLTIAAITMVTGVLGAAAQNEIRKILSFHIISQIGYMIMGLAIFTPLAIAGAIYFVIHNMFAKTNLFLISGIIQRLAGSFELKNLGGMYRANMALSLLFIISAFSLAGLPPLSGFWGKLILAKAGFESQQYLIVAISFLTGVLTLFSMTKIWLQVFWKPFPLEAERKSILPLTSRENAVILTPVIALSLLIVFLGLFVDPLIRYLLLAADDLLNPARYAAVLLGKGDFIR